MEIIYKTQKCEHTRKTKEQFNLVFLKYFRLCNLIFVSISVFLAFHVCPRRLFMYKDYTRSTRNHAGELNVKGNCSNAAGSKKAGNFNVLRYKLF